MPVAHFSQHAYGTWLPDRPQGYVHHADGLRPADPDMADAYRRRQREPTARFDAGVQRLMIEVAIGAQDPQRITIHSCGTDPAHLHVALAWRDDRATEAVCRALKQSLTRSLNTAIGRRTWFTKGFDRKPVRDAGHLRHLVEVYHPSHRGWCWSREGGFRPPRVGPAGC